MSRTPRATVRSGRRVSVTVLAIALLTAACSHHPTQPRAAATPASPTAGTPTGSTASATATTAGSTAASAAASTQSPSEPSLTSSLTSSLKQTRQPSPTPRPTATPTFKPAPTLPAGTSRASGTSKASGTDVLAGTSCQVFPANNYWHADVRSLPVDAHSTAWLSAMGASSRHLHPDFGPSGDTAAPYGIPVTVAASGHARVPVAFDYADESDELSYPFGTDTKIEGGPKADGDRHAIVVTADTCELFETWDTHSTATGWTAGSGAHWSLSSNALRPAGWTSADAAGLPILPGLLRWDEVAAGHVDHAIRFTTNTTDASYLWPARHDASSSHNSSLPPMGARFRLKAGFSLAGYSAQTQTVLRAMQTYGLVLADNGSPWYFQGTADNSWPDSLIEQLKSIPASAFEAVDTSGLEVSPGSGATR
jgi:hypothetical protein